MKDEMNWLQIDILGIIKLRGTGTEHFLSEDHLAY